MKISARLKEYRAGGVIPSRELFDELIEKAIQLETEVNTLREALAHGPNVNVFYDKPATEEGDVEIMRWQSRLGND